MNKIISFKKFFEEVYYDSRREVEGYVDANDLVGQRLWFHTNRTHRNNGQNGMIGVYDTTRGGRKTGLAGKYTNEVRLKAPIFFQTSESGARTIKQRGDRVLIAGVSGVVVIISASEVYFNASEDGNWDIFVKDPVYS